VADRLGRNPEAVQSLVELAEAGAIPVIDAGAVLSFPSTHPLDATGTDVLAAADVILLLDVDQVENTLNTYDRYTRAITSRTKPGARVVTMGVSDLWIRSTMTDYGRLYPVEMTVAADTSLALPELAEELRRLLGKQPNAQASLERRRSWVQERKAAAQKRWQEEAGREAGKRPVSHFRLAEETWKCVRGEAWTVVGNPGGWVRRLWQMDRLGCSVGGQAAAALGSSMPRAIGVGLAAKSRGGFCVAFETDGDLLYVPTSIWTAVHHKIPMLVLLLDNGGYIGEGGHVAWTSQHRERPTDKKYIATEIKNPSVDFASLARSQGAYAEGPVDDPQALGPAIGRAFQAMRREGAPALVWVKTG
jgi:benzoylformate decarboxylase/acetolactate synthase-1/2/3 large subunit